MAQRAATRDEVCGPLGTPGGVAPDLNAATDEQVQLFLDIAALLVWPDRWRKLTSAAHAYLTAHLLATTPGLGLGPGGTEIEDVVGPVVSESDGPASRTFAQLASTTVESLTDADLARTPYGRAFQRFRKAQRGFGSVLVAGGRFAP